MANKLIVLASLLLLLTMPSLGQDGENSDRALFSGSAFYISLGIPSILMAENPSVPARQWSFSAHYQTRLFDELVVEAMYYFVQSNNFTQHFDYEHTRDAFIRQLLPGDWNAAFRQSVFTHHLGVKLHFDFINTRRWFLSLNLTGGLYSSRSREHQLIFVRHFLETPDIIEGYTANYKTMNAIGFFYMPGLQWHLRLNNGFFLGAKAHVALYDTRTSLRNPWVLVNPVHANLGFFVGKRFN